MFIIIFGVLTIIIAFLVYASSSISSNVYIKTICHNSENKILLTFDDGPHPILTPIILDLLKKYNAHAIFFVIGKNAEENPEIIKRIIANGHQIGIHTYSHSGNFPLLKTKDIENELKQTQKIIQKITNTTTTLFRPPFGVTNPNIARAVNNLKLQTIGWSIRSLDTSLPIEKSYDRVITRLHKDAIILLHDNRDNTPNLTQKILEHLNSHNIQIQ